MLVLQQSPASIRLPAIQGTLSLAAASQEKEGQKWFLKKILKNDIQKQIFGGLNNIKLLETVSEMLNQIYLKGINSWSDFKSTHFSFHRQMKFNFSKQSLTVHEAHLRLCQAPDKAAYARIQPIPSPPATQLALHKCHPKYNSHSGNSYALCSASFRCAQSATIPGNSFK